MIKIKNRSTNKQTNKQTNKHILDLEYLSQIKSDLHEILRETSFGCSTMIKAKNKQIYKQTNKQTNKQINISQSNFLILNISAKSSWIFTKFSGYIPVGVPRRFK